MVTFSFIILRVAPLGILLDTSQTQSGYGGGCALRKRQVAPWKGSAVENFGGFCGGYGDAVDTILILKCFGGCPGTCMGWQVADSCASCSMLLWGVSAGSAPLSPTCTLLAGCVHICQGAFV